MGLQLENLDNLTRRFMMGELAQSRKRYVLLKRAIEPTMRRADCRIASSHGPETAVWNRDTLWIELELTDERVVRRCLQSLR
jgi:hypothetical protein